MNTKVLLVFAGLAIATSLASDCGRCDRSECKIIEFCTFGVTLDKCSCCEICSQSLGQKCDVGMNDVEIDTKKIVNGTCGEFLVCSDEGVCRCADDDQVCGSDGKTYDSVCALMDSTTKNDDLTLVERSPCRDGPIIKSPPKDSSRPMGSILVLDCEATGFPVPTISWELYKEDGSVIHLPSDDATMAVQVRGGPEKNMASGWVQIMEILPENVGIYTCVATNEKGSVKAGAKVSISQNKEKKKKVSN